MNEAIRDGLVIDYKDLIDLVTLPDPNDRHILAAAIRAGARVLVTYNLKDFPAVALTKLGIEAFHPDNFLMMLIDFDAERVCGAVKRQREALRNLPKTTDEFLLTLESQGLV